MSAISDRVTDAQVGVDLTTVDSHRPFLNHYLRKNSILRGIVEGKPQRAICGETFVPESFGNGEVSYRTNGELVICPICAHLFDALPE